MTSLITVDLAKEVRSAELEAYRDIECRLTFAALCGWTRAIVTRPEVEELFGPVHVTLVDMPRTFGSNEAETHRHKPTIEVYPKGRNLRVLLHELAHVYTDRVHGYHIPAHSPLYARNHVALADIVFGSVFSDRLQRLYRYFGVTDND